MAELATLLAAYVAPAGAGLWQIDWALQHVDWLAFGTIPIFTGVIGWLINWTGLIMLFSPVRFHGVKLPGMSDLAKLAPRKLQEVPGVLQGGLGSATRARSCLPGPATSGARTPDTRRTRGSSPSWPRTKHASCCCCCARALSRQSTYAPADRSGW